MKKTNILMIILSALNFERSLFYIKNQQHILMITFLQIVNIMKNKSNTKLLLEFNINVNTILIIYIII